MPHEEVSSKGYRRVALQFPDAMLPDAPVVCCLLTTLAKGGEGGAHPPPPPPPATQNNGDIDHSGEGQRERDVLFFIIGDTSYGSCCVDEVAAQHLAADCVVHYGPACLSPTARLPVIHVFGRKPFTVLQACSQALATRLTEAGVATAMLFYDPGYATYLPELGPMLAAHLGAGGAAAGGSSDGGVELVVARIPTPTVPTASGPLFKADPPAAACCGGGGGSCGGSEPPHAAPQPAPTPTPTEQQGGADEGVGGGIDGLPSTTQEKKKEEEGEVVIAGGLEVRLPRRGRTEEEGEAGPGGRKTVVVYIGAFSIINLP